MKCSLFPGLVAGLLLGSCDKAMQSQSNEAEEASGDFEDQTESDPADGPRQVAGFSCKTTVQETSPARTLVDCELKEPKSQFELPTPADGETIQVLVDGAELPREDFKYDELTGILEILKEVTAQKVSIYYDQHEEAAETPEPQTDGFTAGTIVDLTGLDGCRFLIQLPTGKRLEPTNLPPEFKKDGLEVTFKFVEQKDLASACMAGKIVAVSDMAEKTK